MVTALPDLTIVILTYNETLHIQRAILSAQRCAQDVLVVDSYSNDDTIQLAQILGARVIQHPFVNQAQQFQWALENGGIKTQWVMRLDADEYLTPGLEEELKTKIPLLEDSISGVVVKRQVHFMGQWIRHGGYYPVELLRVWRTGHAAIEQRRMDEHIYLLKGRAEMFAHDLIDANLNTLSWWITKHNEYATREAADILAMRYPAKSTEIDEQLKGGARLASRTRWLKSNVYLKLPMFLRSFLYFIYRYIFRMGFLDGRRGLVWHFLQGFWYRFLVDAKIIQIEWWAKEEGKDIHQVMHEKYGIRL